MLLLLLACTDKPDPPDDTEPATTDSDPVLHDSEALDSDGDNGLRLGLSAGYRWDTHWQFRRENGGWARLDTDSAPFYGIHLGWYRPGDLRAKGS